MPIHIIFQCNAHHVPKSVGRKSIIRVFIDPFKKRLAEYLKSFKPKILALLGKPLDLIRRTAPRQRQDLSDEFPPIRADLLNRWWSWANLPSVPPALFLSALTTEYWSACNRQEPSVPPLHHLHFSAFLWLLIILFPSKEISPCVGVLNSDKNRHVKADGLVGAARRPSAKGRQISWAQAYEKRMRIFNLEVILAALIALALLIGCSFTAWEAFQNSVPGASW
jgi:hypothetical protein